MSFKSIASKGYSLNSTTAPVPAVSSGDTVLIIQTWYDGSIGNFSEFPAGYSPVLDVDSLTRAEHRSCYARAWAKNIITPEDEPSTYNFTQQYGGKCTLTLIVFSDRGDTSGITAKFTNGTTIVPSPVPLTLQGVSTSGGENILWACIGVLDTVGTVVSSTPPATYTSRDTYIRGRTTANFSTKDTAQGGGTGVLEGELILSESNASAFGMVFSLPGVAGPDYTARKGSTATITHTLTADGITTATLDGETVTIGTQSGQDADIALDETAITTSGEYDLVLGDGVGTETFTVQYNVIGLTTNTIQKDGASIGAQTDVEMHILDATGATVLGNLTGLTTDASGITGQTIVPAGAVDDSVRVIGYSDAAEIGFAYKTTLGLL